MEIGNIFREVHNFLENLKIRIISMAILSKFLIFDNLLIQWDLDATETDCDEFNKFCGRYPDEIIWNLVIRVRGSLKGLQESNDIFNCKHPQKFKLISLH